MPLYSFANWEFGVGLASLLDEAKYLADVDDFLHMGTSDEFRNSRVARDVNRAVSDFAEKNPVLGDKTSEQTLTSGTTTYAIPTDLGGLGIERIRFKDQAKSSYYDGRDLEFADKAAVSMMPVTWRNGEITYQYPQYWGFDETSDNIVFYPTPSDSTIITQIIHRQEHDRITSHDVESPRAIIANSDFSSGTGWATTTGWAIANGVATFSGDTGPRTATLTSSAASVKLGKTYLVKYEVTNTVPKASPTTNVKVAIKLGDIVGTYVAAPAAYSELLTVTAADTETQGVLFLGVGIAAKTISVDNVSVQIAIRELMYEFMHVPAHYLAWKLAVPVDMQKAEKLRVDYMIYMRELQEKIGRHIASFKAGGQDQTFPNKAIQENQILNLGPADAGRYGRGY